MDNTFVFELNTFLLVTLTPLKPGVYIERKSTPYTQTIVRTWGAYSRPPMPIYTVVTAHRPIINTPTIRRLLRVDAGLSLANSDSDSDIYFATT